jgi:hypothetical protein
VTSYDFDRPFIDQETLPFYVAVNRAAARYGKTVRAAQLSNVEYQMRFNRLKQKHSMKPPPSCGRIFMGYLVVRNLGRADQYETWIPDHAFEELYRAKAQEPVSSTGSRESHG